MTARITVLPTPGLHLAHLRRHFALILTTATALDESTGTVWTIRLMRKTYGADTVATWLADRAGRRDCLPDDVPTAVRAVGRRTGGAG